MSTEQLSPKFQGDEKFLAGLDVSTRQEFSRWFEDLDAENVRLGCLYDAPLAESTGIECWFGYFDDGYSVSAAMTEDSSYD